jgi:hypothetical protein
VDYYCNPQCEWVWVNNEFPTPFSFMYNDLKNIYDTLININKFYEY